MTSDGELLRRYTEFHSEDAFAELVRRHLDLVYSAALRQVNGDAHLAQDVAQSVFADLARKAGSLVDRQALAGWLYTGAHYGAAKAVRSEQRRRTREQEAHAMQQLLHDPGPNPDWEMLQPLLDSAMHELSEADREVILLRYFENRPHADIGEQFGISENTARMRIDRALEKLRTMLSRRGVTTSAATLSVVLAANAVQAAPAGLAVTISTAAAVGGTTAASAATATATKAIAMTALQKTIVTATVAVLAGAGMYEARQAAKAREQNHTLQQQQALLTEQLQQLSQALIGATNQVAALRADNERMNRIPLELLKLRGEVGVLRREAAEAGSVKARTAQPPLPTAGEYLDRGTKHFASGESEDALDDMNKALELDPNSTEALYYRAHLLAAGSPKSKREPEVAKAVADFSRILELKPNDGHVRSFRAFWYGVLKQYDNAIADYTTVIEGNADLSKFNEGRNQALAQMHLNRGQLYQEAGKEYAKAIADYTAALQLNPKIEGAYRLRGQCYELLGNAEKAQQDFAVEKLK